MHSCEHSWQKASIEARDGRGRKVFSAPLLLLYTMPLPVVQPVLSDPTPCSLSVEWHHDLADEDLGEVSHFAIQWRVVGTVDDRGSIIPIKQESHWQSSAASEALQSVRCVKKGLLAGTAYTFRVKACDADGNGCWGALAVPVATLTDSARRSGAERPVAPMWQPEAPMRQPEAPMRPRASINGPAAAAAISAARAQAQAAADQDAEEVEAVRALAVREARAQLKAEAEEEARAQRRREMGAMARARAEAAAEEEALEEARQQVRREAEAREEARMRLKKEAEAVAAARAEAKAQARAILEAEADERARAVADAEARARVAVDAKAELEAIRAGGKGSEPAGTPWQTPRAVVSPRVGGVPGSAPATSHARPLVSEEALSQARHEREKQSRIMSRGAMDMDRPTVREIQTPVAGLLIEWSEVPSAAYYELQVPVRARRVRICRVCARLWGGCGVTVGWALCGYCVP